MKKYYCVHCGRLLGAPVGHRCKGTYRSRNLQFKAFDLVENMNEEKKCIIIAGGTDIHAALAKLEENAPAYCWFNGVRLEDGDTYRDYLSKCDEREKEKEHVNHPAHYNNGSMEVIEMMLKLFGEEKVMAFCELNAYKYRMRAGYKGNAEEDIHKALWYEKKYKEIRQALDEIQPAGLASNGDVVYADSSDFRLKREGLTQRQIDNILKK